jgi:Ca2+-binding EF-hand superfamily protein
MKISVSGLALLVWLARLVVATGVGRNEVASFFQRDMRHMLDSKHLRGRLAQPHSASWTDRENKRALALASDGNLGEKRSIRVQSEHEGGDDNDTLTHELVDQATTQPVKKRFDAVDRNSDGKIDLYEYVASTRADERVARYRFNCSDADVDHVLDLKEFAESQAKPQELERCVSMMLAFRMIDADRNGHLSQHELWNAAGPPTFDGSWAFQVACSDLNNDGKIAPMEFSTDMYSCMEDKAATALKRFENFSSSDANGNGCADEAEMAAAINMLFGLNLLSDRGPARATRLLTRRWVSCVDFDSDQCLSEKEYSSLSEPTQQEAACIGTNYMKYEADMDFEIMDTNRDNKISRQEFYTWCSNIDMSIDQKDADALFTAADKNKNGFIEEIEFVDAGDEHKGDGPGVFFFSHLPAGLKPHMVWRGSLSKTWAGLFEH